MNGAPLETPSDGSAGDESLSEERLFDLLGNERRRSCLQCLALVDGVMTVQDLATDVATIVSDDDCSPEDVRDSVYISLCQNHLPKLDDAGVVDYSSEAKTVGPGPAFPAVERHLQVDHVDDVGGGTSPSAVLVSAVTVLVLGVGYAVPHVLTYGVPALLAVHAVVVVVMGHRLL